MDEVRRLLKLPEDLVPLLDPTTTMLPEDREALVLDALRHARITQGQAAHLLGITRYDILDLMVLHKIPSGPETAEEMREEIENARRFVKRGVVVGRGQRQ